MKLLSVLSLSLVFIVHHSFCSESLMKSLLSVLKANSSKNASPVLKKRLPKIKAEYKEGEKVILRFPEGRL